MRQAACRCLTVLSLVLLPAATGSALLHAQDRVPAELVARQGIGATAAPSGLDRVRAEDLRNEFRELMRQYPPALGRVLRLDSSLMTNANYLAAYPALAAFLTTHPEVARYPHYFLNFVGEGSGWSSGEPLNAEAQLRREAINVQRNLFDGLTIVGAISAVALGVVWLVRMFMSHRRWLRATRLQSELNNRLLERMGSNEQLLAYLQSQTGQQLMAVPAATEAAAPATAAPFGRILWAVQAGLVLACAGVGMLVIQRYVFAEAGDMMLTLGVLAISIGVGFAAASYASYLLSRRFGLIDDARTGSRDAGGA